MALARLGLVPHGIEIDQRFSAAARLRVGFAAGLDENGPGFHQIGLGNGELVEPGPGRAQVSQERGEIALVRAGALFLASGSAFASNSTTSA